MIASLLIIGLAMHLKEEHHSSIVWSVRKNIPKN